MVGSIPRISARRITVDSRLAVRFRRGGRRHRSHGGYSYLTTGTLPEQRSNVLKYLMAVRQGLVRDLGPTEDNLSTAQIILIDRITTKLGVIRCVEEHIRENSVMAGDDLSLSLKASYLAYNNSLRLDLQALGLEKKGEAVLTPYEIIERERKAEEASE
jgi:hypothetical protein